MTSPFTKVYPYPYIGIIGSGSDKFTPEGEAIAKHEITRILSPKKCVLVSGHSPIGGIDIWSEERFKDYYPEIEPRICKPDINQWNPIVGGKEAYGYKKRNQDIARFSDELHVIVPSKYPKSYTGEKYFDYHCFNRFGEAIYNTENHIKSGACWTGNVFRAMKGIPPVYHIIDNGEK